MGLKFSEQQLANGRSTLTNSYDGYPVTPQSSSALFTPQLPYQNGQPVAAEAVYAAGAGTITMTLDAAGNTAVVTAAAGSLIPVTFLWINSTGTTATGLYALTRNGG